MKMKGRIINGGEVKAEAFVIGVPFSFIGDFEPETGKCAIEGHPLYGKSMANKILVCPTGKGGTIAPFIAYDAWKAGKAPAAILCIKADPILCESALVIEIPILDEFDANLFMSIKTGQMISICGNEVVID
jgi:predicted aconitase with swiveling domain